jgi:hypothetical protein
MEAKSARGVLILEDAVRQVEAVVCRRLENPALASLPEQGTTVVALPVLNKLAKD